MAVRIAVDAMGGDHAPRTVARGALRALADHPDLELVLVGDQARVEEELASWERSASGHGRWSAGNRRVVNCERWEVVHAPQVVAMDEEPLEPLRTRKDSLLVRMVEWAADGAVGARLG